MRKSKTMITPNVFTALRMRQEIRDLPGRFQPKLRVILHSFSFLPDAPGGGTEVPFFPRRETEILYRIYTKTGVNSIAANRTAGASIR